MNSFTCFDNGTFAEPQSVKKLASAENASVLLVSDTHGDFESVQNMLYAYGKTADALMFAGDGMEDFFAAHIVCRSPKRDPHLYSARRVPCCG